MDHCPCCTLQVLYNSVRLGIYRTKREDINKYNRPVLLGKGLYVAFKDAFDIVFEEKQPWELSDAEVARRGAWILTASQAMLAYQSVRSGTRGKGAGMQSQLSIEGFNYDEVNRLLTKLKKLVGDTPNAEVMRKRARSS